MISIEREVYPALIERKEPVFAFLSDAYWMDLGTPERYLQAHFDVLDGRVSGLTYDVPFIATTADVAADARVLGAGAEVGEGAVVTGSVLAERVRVADGASVDGARLGPGETAG